MAKPLSRPNEVGRAIGYQVDINMLLERLDRKSLGAWDDLKNDNGFIEQVGRAAEAQVRREDNKRPNRIWVVVKIEHGIPVMIDAYHNKRSASQRERFLRQHMRPETDDVVLLDIQV